MKLSAGLRGRCRFITPPPNTHCRHEDLQDHPDRLAAQHDVQPLGGHGAAAIPALLRHGESGTAGCRHFIFVSPRLQGPETTLASPVSRHGALPLLLALLLTAGGVAGGLDSKHS